MLSNTVKGLKSELSANHLWEVGLSGYSRFSRSNSPLLLLLLLKLPPALDLLDPILEEADDEPPAEPPDDDIDVEDDDPPLEWLFILALSMVNAGATP